MNIEDYDKIKKYLSLEKQIKKHILNERKYDQTIDSSWSALMLIIKYGGTYNTETILNMLIENGNLEYENKNGINALMLAIYYGKDKIVEKLISKYTSTNSKDNNGLTPLMYLANYSQSIKTIKNLISSIDDIELKLIHKNITNVDKIIDLLLDHNVDINSQCKQGKTALMYCIENPENIKVNYNNIKKLINKKADVNIKDITNKTALIYAIEMYPTHKTTDIIELLLSVGADTNIVDNNEHTPLTLAITLGSTYLVKLLLNNGAIIDYNNKNPLFLQVLYQNDNKTIIDMIDLILNKNVDINIRDIHQCTPLMYACYYCKGDDVIKYLLESNADITLKNINEDSAYDFCARNPTISQKIKNNLRIKGEYEDRYTISYISKFLFGE